MSERRNWKMDIDELKATPDPILRTLLELMSEYVAEDSARQLPSGSRNSELAAEIAKRRGWKLCPLKESNLHPDDILGVPHLTEKDGGER